MNDLISRQAAIDALQKEINKGIPPFNDVCGSIRAGVRLARNIIEDLPSAEPERIHCKECKHYIPHDKRCGYWNHGVSLNWWDEWCSHGERRADDGE